MPQTQVLGKSGNPLEVDPQYLAARIALRPLDYTGQGKVLGHYGIGQRSGEIAATLGAARTSGAPPLGPARRYLVPCPDATQIGHQHLGRRDQRQDRAGL
jgi:hypothetical protein